MRMTHWITRLLPMAYVVSTAKLSPVLTLGKEDEFPPFGGLHTPMVFTATPSDLIVMGMKHKLKAICPNGKLEIVVFYNEQYMGHSLHVWAIAKGQRVKVGEQWVAQDIGGKSLQEHTWGDYLDLFEVSDQIYATLMLLYPDM